jgi:SET domain
MNALTEVNLAGLERAMAALPQLRCNVIHAFGPGIYIRQVTLPAGALVMGHRHKCDHLNILLKGRMTLFNADGTRDELAAPVVCTGSPGRKVALIHEEVLWLNLWATMSTDVAALEAEFIDKTDGIEILSQEAIPADRANQIADFALFAQEIGFDPSLIREISENEFDQIPFPRGVYKCIIGPSSIEGLGLLASSDIAAGETIAPAGIDEKRTPAGRYTNHSRDPNARMVVRGRQIDLVALKPIQGAQGGRPGEEITVNYREVFNLFPDAVDM